MTPFQDVVLVVLAILIVRDGSRLLRRRGRASAAPVRTLIWMVTASAIAFPNVVQKAAELLGIGRGMNLVLYLFVLAFIATTFYFYSRYARLQRQITELVRHHALAHANPGQGRKGFPSQKAE